MILHGDLRDVLPGLDAESVHACVTDPPYELGFMGKAWDRSGIAFQPETWAAVFRVLKPGGHLLAFGGSRTAHRIAVAIEDAGFEVRDTICWLYGSGFPKSLDVSKAIDKAAGAEREVIGRGPYAGRRPNGSGGVRNGDVAYGDFNGDPDHIQTAPATDAAREWDGWGTALKPAHEPVIVARKPFRGTVAANVAAHGTGAINVDACRIGTDTVKTNNTAFMTYGGENARPWHEGHSPTTTEHVGRWPPNVCLDEDAAALLDAMSGVSASSSRPMRHAAATMGYGGATRDFVTGGYDDHGGASRFFYVAKASRRERDAGLQCSCYNQAWASQDHQANTPAEPGTRPPRATIGSTSMGECGWPTSPSGNDTTDPSLTGSRFTTSTATSKTTASTTSNLSMPLPTNGCTPDANSATAFGGSHAASAESASPLTPSTGTSAARAGRSTDDAGPAISPASSPTSGSDGRCPNCGQLTRSIHPTVKPIALMRWLVRLVTPPGGTVLDPFAGSGTTGIACALEGFDFLGVEREAEYVEIAERRIAHHADAVRAMPLPLEGVA